MRRMPIAAAGLTAVFVLAGAGCAATSSQTGAGAGAAGAATAAGGRQLSAGDQTLAACMDMSPERRSQDPVCQELAKSRPGMLEGAAPPAR